MKARLHKELQRLAIILLIGFAYLAFVLITGWRIPCIFKVITGFDCPGCGITRMCVSIAKLDFVAAFRFNPVVFTTLPLMLGCIAYERITYIKYGICKNPLICKIFLCIEIILLLAYGVIRNIG
ncbi:MAG: DUF2752 domain-containing protein [Ruminococcaceae bacterium]|nr:DUF2752 domain-containing protein [Oscillospiraceae bacterium]